METLGSRPIMSKNLCALCPEEELRKAEEMDLLVCPRGFLGKKTTSSSQIAVISVT